MVVVPSVRVVGVTVYVGLGASVVCEVGEHCLGIDGAGQEGGRGRVDADRSFEAEQSHVGPTRHRHRCDRATTAGSRWDHRCSRCAGSRASSPSAANGLLPSAIGISTCWVDRNERARRRQRRRRCRRRRRRSSSGNACRRPTCSRRRFARAEVRVESASVARSVSSNMQRSRPARQATEIVPLAELMIANCTASAADALVIERGASPVVAIEEVARVDDRAATSSPPPTCSMSSQRNSSHSVSSAKHISALARRVRDSAIVMSVGQSRLRGPSTVGSYA